MKRSIGAQSTEQLLSAIRKVSEEVGAGLCILFGSRAGRPPRVEADVDLALSFRIMPSPERRLEIIGRFQTAAGPLPVDVVFLHRDTDPVLRFEVFRSGRLVFEQDDGDMVEQRVLALMMYEDVLPLRRMRRQKLLQGDTG